MPIHTFKLQIYEQQELVLSTSRLTNKVDFQGLAV